MGPAQSPDERLRCGVGIVVEMVHGPVPRSLALVVAVSACGPVVDVAAPGGASSSGGTGPSEGTAGPGGGPSVPSSGGPSTQGDSLTEDISSGSWGSTGSWGTWGSSGPWGSSGSTGTVALGCDFDGVAKPTGVLYADGTTVELLPSGIRFAVPQLVQDAVTSTVLASDDELATAQSGQGPWTAQYSGVANMLLAFDRCGAHMGNDTWPNSDSWLALWTRAYIFERSIAELEASFVDSGAGVAQAVGGSSPEVSQSIAGDWRITQLAFDLSFSESAGRAVVDMRLREYGGTAVGFVFMYPQGGGGIPNPAGSIDEVLQSVCVPDGAGGCCAPG